MRIFITGAHGQVGQALIANAALQPEIELRAYSKDGLDIRSLPAVMLAVSTDRPDVIINAAAYTNVEQAQQDSTAAYAINAQGVDHLAQACRAFAIPLLHISTDYIFSGEKNTPYAESDAPQPLNIYGASKLAGEQLAQAVWEKTIILRTSWVFSATGHNFVKTMLRLFAEKKEVRVVQDQTGGPTAADAIAQALLTIAHAVLKPTFSDWGVYHFSGAPAVSWYAFAVAIRQQAVHNPLLLEQLSPISSAEFCLQAPRPRYTALATEKIRATFGLSPADWRSDLLQVIKKLQKNS